MMKLVVLVRGDGDRAAVVEELDKVQTRDRMPAIDVVRFDENRMAKLEATDCMKQFKRHLKTPRPSVVVDNPMNTRSSWQSYLATCGTYSDRKFRVIGVDVSEEYDESFAADVEIVTPARALEILKEHTDDV